jgi:hypothetical protein
MTKDYKADDEEQPLDIPERHLWMAVIERALKDYCFFFDKLCSTGTGHLIDINRLNAANVHDFNLKAIGQFNRLRWFIFNKEPKPFNLQYLANELYDDGDGTAGLIRKEASKQFKRHLKEIEDKNKFVAIVSYIKQNTTAADSEAAEKESKLRNKRYRMFS